MPKTHLDPNKAISIEGVAVRFITLSVAVFIALAGGTWAQEGRASYEPLIAETVAATSDAEGVRREAGRTGKIIKGLELRPATVADIDLNGDGHISFEELFRFDVKKDF